MGRIIIRFKNGEVFEFDNDHDKFQLLANQIFYCWSNWFYIGKRLVVNRKEILYVQYEGDLNGQEDPKN